MSSPSDAISPSINGLPRRDTLAAPEVVDLEEEAHGAPAPSAKPFVAEHQAIYQASSSTKSDRTHRRVCGFSICTLLLGLATVSMLVLAAVLAGILGLEASRHHSCAKEVSNLQGYVHFLLNTPTTDATPSPTTCPSRPCTACPSASSTACPSPLPAPKPSTISARASTITVSASPAASPTVLNTSCTNGSSWDSLLTYDTYVRICNTDLAYNADTYNLGSGYTGSFDCCLTMCDGVAYSYNGSYGPTAIVWSSNLDSRNLPGNCSCISTTGIYSLVAATGVDVALQPGTYEQTDLPNGS